MSKKIAAPRHFDINNIGAVTALVLLVASTASAQVYPGATWETATPVSQGFDPVAFQAAFNALPSPAVVIRHGYLVGSKGDIAEAKAIWSGSKSLAALIAARTLHENLITLDQLVPGSGSPLASYRHFLTMTSDFLLSPHQPGAHYAYNNGAVHHYASLLQTVFYPRHSASQMLRAAYGTAIGFQDSVSYRGYLSGWNGGWSVSTRDMARVAYLVLRDGNWNGVQLLPVWFVVDLEQNQIPATATLSPDNDADDFYLEQPFSSQLPGCYSSASGCRSTATASAQPHRHTPCPCRELMARLFISCGASTWWYQR
jgi:hypothetical protein